METKEPTNIAKMVRGIFGNSFFKLYFVLNRAGNGNLWGSLFRAKVLIRNKIG